MLTFVMLSGLMLSVIMLGIVMQCVALLSVAKFWYSGANVINLFTAVCYEFS